MFPRKSISNLTQNQLERMLKDFIKLEDPQKPLSDEKLVNKFKEKEISIVNCNNKLNTFNQAA